MINNAEGYNDLKDLEGRHEIKEDDITTAIDTLSSGCFSPTEKIIRPRGRISPGNFDFFSRPAPLRY
jgi:hypothetical protein